MRLTQVSLVCTEEPSALWCVVSEPPPAQRTVFPLPYGVPPVRGQPPAEQNVVDQLWARVLDESLADTGPVGWRLLAEPHPAAATGPAPPGELSRLISVFRAMLGPEAEHGEILCALGTIAPPKILCSEVYSLPSSPGYYFRLLHRMRTLAAAGERAPGITRQLQTEGFTLAPGRSEPIGLATVQRLLREDRAAAHATRPPAAPSAEAPGANEWWLGDLAAELAMPSITLYNWLRRGLLAGRQEARPPYRWIVYASAERLCSLRERRTGARDPSWRRYPGWRFGRSGQ